MSHRRLPTVLLSITIALSMLAACGSEEVAGTPGPLDDMEMFTVAGLPVTDGPSGPRDGVSDADLDVEGTDGSDVDRLATNAMADLQAYWTDRFREDFNAEFTPLTTLVSYDSAGRAQTVCGTSTEGLVNAFYCPPEDTIAWDRGELLPSFAETFGPMSVVLVLAHETGHAVQSRLDLVDAVTPTIVSEQQADCFAGAFFRHVAQGNSEHFEISTGPGLGRVLASVFSLRDPTGGVLIDPAAHGNAFDRVSAFQFGFAEGPTRCGRIDTADVAQRATQFGFGSQQEAATGGDLEINEENLRLVDRSLDAAFRTNQVVEPQIALQPQQCDDARPTEVAAYCPATNTVTTDLGELTRVGAEASPDRGIGDFAAYAVYASRYVLSVERASGLPLNTARAGLTTACLVGAWAGVLLETPFGNRNPIDDPPLRLAAGDLDEAVAELLSDGLIASGVNGETVPSAFARVEAFRMGFLQGSTPCTG